MNQPLIGAPSNRVDGPLKVTGRARYTADIVLDDMLHAVVVTSTIANGRIVAIDDARARETEGVVAVMTHRNAPLVKAGKHLPHDSLLFLLQDDAVQYDRQPVAVVVAQTLEQATHAAQLVQVTYDARAPQLDLDTAERFRPEEIFGEPATFERGTPKKAFEAADAAVAQTYTTPTEHHNPIETHATIARWEGDRLTLYDATQWVFGVQRRMAAVFGLDQQRVRVISKFVGGAFGCKGQPWSHVALAAMAAKLVDRPVKLVVTRPQMFAWIGHRPQTRQTVALGAERDGRLVAVSHDTTIETSIADEFIEGSGLFSRDLYPVANFGMSHELARLNISKPTYQRGPGEATGSFAMESAMDELAYALNLDPLELRLRNYAERDPHSDKPYTAKHLRECYRLGAERFGWSARNPQPRATTEGRMLVGTGMASAIRGSFRSECAVRMRAHADGSVVVECGTIEQGTGSPTVFSQLAAELLEIPIERVRFEWGDTELPYAPLAAGSMTAASIACAVIAAAQKLRERLAAAGGHIPEAGIEVELHETPPDSEDDYAQQSFGAHFAQVAVDPELGTVRVTRFVGAFDAGRILNAKTAESQLLGGIVWGISMALFEKTRFDPRTARIVNANLADYLVPTSADIPDVEILMVEADDPNANPAHVRGIGEVGISGAAAAVANAVYHATGVRVRDLPIGPEKLLG